MTSGQEGSHIFWVDTPAIYSTDSLVEDQTLLHAIFAFQRLMVRVMKFGLHTYSDDDDPHFLQNMISIVLSFLCFTSIICEGVILC